MGLTRVKRGLESDANGGLNAIKFRFIQADFPVS
jgi:hypothetical protein